MHSDAELKRKAEKYIGKFVATRSFDAIDVVSYGKDAKKVHDEAKRKGVKSPVVFFVPRKNMTHLF